MTDKDYQTIIDHWNKSEQRIARLMEKNLTRQEAENVDWEMNKEEYSSFIWSFLIPLSLEEIIAEGSND